MRRILGTFAVAASLAVTSAAWAEQPAPNPEAVRHFLEGKRLRDEGRCDLAVKELELSVQKEPSIGGHYNLGVCYEKSNKRASLANYKRAEELAKERGDDRLREIRAQLADFLDKTAHIRLALPQPLPPDMRVTVDGDVIPTEELQGETIYFLGAEKSSYDVRATANGYEEQKLAIDASTVKKKMLVTVALKKQSDGSIAQPMVPKERETKWGPFQFLGLGLMVLGAGGITFATVNYVTYESDEQNLKQKFDEAKLAAEGCASNSPPESTCRKNIDTREDLRRQYDANEADAKDKRPLWLSVGIGGILAVGGGVLLIAFGPKNEVAADPGATAKAPKPKVRLLPIWGVREQGLSVVGTF